MITDAVSVANMALNAVGARDNIQALTDTSREGKVCNRWFAAVRDQLLTAARWPSARKFSRLALLSTASDTWADGDPEPPFTYAYSAPTDMLRPQMLSSFMRFTLTAGQNSNLVINTDDPDPILAYTFRQEVISLWDSELQMAVVYGLAANICMPLTGKPGRAKEMLQQANSLIMAAREDAANSDYNPLQLIPDILAARGFASSIEGYFQYPFGPLLGISSSVN